MYLALFLSMQILAAAAPETRPLQTAALTEVRADKPAGAGDQGQAGSAVHNPLRKAPRIAGQAPAARPPVTSQR